MRYRAKIIEVGCRNEDASVHTLMLEVDSVQTLRDLAGHLYKNVYVEVDPFGPVDPRVDKEVG